MANFLKKNWFGIATIVITFAVLIAAAIYTNGFHSFTEAILSAHPAWICVAFALVFIYWLFDALSLHALIIPGDKPFGFLRVFYVTMIGFLYCALTPFAVGGQPMQIYLMAKNGVPAGDAASAITVKSIIYQIGIVVFAVAALVIAGSKFRSEIEFFDIFLMFGFICNMIFIGIIVLICMYSGFAKKGARLLITVLASIKLVKDKDKCCVMTYTQIDLFKSSVFSYKNRIYRLILSCLLAIIQFVAFYSIPYMIFRALGVGGVALPEMISAAALISMITAFVPLPGASGAAEGGFYLFFKLHFSSLAASLSTALIWRAVTYYSVIFVGMAISLAVFLVVKRKERAGKVREAVPAE